MLVICFVLFKAGLCRTSCVDVLTVMVAAMPGLMQLQSYAHPEAESTVQQYVQKENQKHTQMISHKWKPKKTQEQTGKRLMMGTSSWPVHL